jgi:hypothetical protein
LRKVWCLLILIFTAHASAGEIFESHTNARALGMGNAFSPIVNDDESFFYNPAGLARNTGFILTIVDPRAGINDLDVAAVTDSYSDLTDQATFSQGLNNLYGKPLWLGAGAKTSFLSPFLGVALYADIDASINVQNPAAPEFNLNFTYDQGIAIGTGFGFGPAQFGLVGRRVQRQGTRKTFGSGDIAAIIGGASPDIIFDSIDAKGIGYAADLGMNLSLPGILRPTLSFVWKDIGDTSFRTSTAVADRPPSEKSEMSVGMGLETVLPLFSLLGAIEFKHINRDGYDFTKKVHMGVEVGIPFIDLRAGLHQGYLSYGAGISLGIIQLDVASWGVELGEYAGQLEDRRYMVQLSIKMGFDPGIGFTTGQKGSASASQSAAGGGAGGSSSSGYKRRKLKERR